MSLTLNAVAFDTTNITAALFEESTLRYIGEKVKNITFKSELRTPVNVPNDRIKEVLESVFTHFRPNTGDIHTRYVINNTNQYKFINYCTDIIKQTIDIIVNDIQNHFEIVKNNNTFSVWNTLSGVNSRGLRHFAPIKLNERRAAPLQFNMNF
jgi:hypothetical protein